MGTAFGRQQKDDGERQGQPFSPERGNDSDGGHGEPNLEIGQIGEPAGRAVGDVRLLQEDEDCPAGEAGEGECEGT